MVKVAGDGSKRILIGVLAQVRKRREVGWNKSTTVTSVDEGFKSLKIGSIANPHQALEDSPLPECEFEFVDLEKFKQKQ